MKSAPARLIDVRASMTASALVEVAGGDRGLEHRVLAADVVGGHGEVRRVLHAAQHVEVGQRRLDHEDVGALLHVEQRLAHRLVAVRAVHLVGAAVAERGSRVGGLAERPVERGGELRAVGDDRHVAQALVVERVADVADPAVHHVARRDHVAAGAREAHRRARRAARATRRCRRRRRPSAARSGRGSCTRRDTRRRRRSGPGRPA